MSSFFGSLELVCHHLPAEKQKLAFVLLSEQMKFEALSFELVIVPPKQTFVEKKYHTIGKELAIEKKWI